MSRRKPKATCDAAFAFLRERLGRYALAPCTGQDFRALAAWFHLVALWGTGDGRAERAALVALRAVLEGMQPSVWPLAKAGIPAVLDWPHEEQLWSLVSDIPQRAIVDAFARRERGAARGTPEVEAP